MENQETVNADRVVKKNSYVRRLLSYQWIPKNPSFFVFVAFLAILYIANGHEADRIIRDINITESDIKELKYEYKILKSEEVVTNRQGQIVEAAATLGLKLSTPPPVHITEDAGK